MQRVTIDSLNQLLLNYHKHTNTNPPFPQASPHRNCISFRLSLNQKRLLSKSRKLGVRNIAQTTPLFLACKVFVCYRFSLSVRRNMFG